jgi:hypothetical protein
MRRQP